MPQEDKTKDELVEEIMSLQKRIAEFEELDSECKHVEEDTLVSKMHLSYLTKYANDLIILLDENFRFLEINERVIDSYGYSQKELIGMHATQLRAPEARDSFEKQVKPVREMGKALFETLHQRKEGTKFPVEISLRAIDVNKKRFYQAIIRDITERKKVEESLRKSEKEYRFLFESLPISIGITTLDGKGIASNRGCEELTGYTKEEFSTFKDTSEMYVDRAQRNQLMVLLQKEGKVRDFEVELKRKDGTIYCALMNLDFIELSGELAIMTSVRDITERKKMEEALRTSEELYREFFHTSLDCIFITTEKGEWINCNDAALEMFGYNSREELFKITVNSLYESQEERTKLLDLIEKQGSVKEYPVRLKGKNGPVMDALITSGLRQNMDGSKEYFGTIRDITESKKIEQTLRLSEERYRMLADNSSDVIYIQDITGRFTYMSPSVTRQRGYTPEEAAQLTLAQTLTPDSLKVAVGFFSDAVAKIKVGKVPESVHFEVELYCKDGSTVWCEVRSSAMYNSLGEFVGFMGVSRNISERKKMEEEMKKQLHELEVFYKASLGREERILELKKEIERLKNELGK